jgi:hypothetical protein
MGLNVEDLIQVEDYAAKLRHGLKPTTTDSSSSDEGKSKNATSRSQLAAPRRPSISNKQLEKLSFELERLHHESQECRDMLRDAEGSLTKTRDENRALESVIREISLTLIKTRAETGGSSNSLSFPSIEKLVKFLEVKEKRMRASDMKDAMANEDIIEMNIVLRDELCQVRSLIDSSNQEVDNMKRELRNTQAETAKYKEKAEIPRKRVMHLPADLALGTVHDYSALVEQLVECLLDLETKDKVILENRKALEEYHVSHLNF